MRVVQACASAVMIRALPRALRFRDIPFFGWSCLGWKLGHLRRAS